MFGINFDIYVIQENDYDGPFETYFFRNESERNSYLKILEANSRRDWITWDFNCGLHGLLKLIRKGKISTLNNPVSFWHD